MVSILPRISNSFNFFKAFGDRSKHSIYYWYHYENLER